jgi:hypothetical protein
MDAPNPNKHEEILERFPFNTHNLKSGGEIQIIRATVIKDGQERVYINKRLLFTGTGRYINLPRDGVEEMVDAIYAASEPEQRHHEALMAQINQRTKRTPNFDQKMDRSRRRGRDDKGDMR